MSDPRPDAERSQLRAIVAKLDKEISLLAPAGVCSASATDLRASWADLVELLALGPEPELRECPVCQHIGIRAATRCGYCWTSLS